LELLLKRRWFFVAALFLGTVALLPGVQYAVVPDNALTVWFLDDDPALVAYNQFHEVYGNDEVVLLYVDFETSLFTADGLQTLGRLHDALQATEGVASVRSLWDARDLSEAADGSLLYTPLLPRPPPADLTELKRRVTGHPLFTGRLLSADGSKLMLWVQMAVMDDFDARRDAVVDAVRATADQALAGQPFAIAGTGVIYSGLNRVTQRDAGLFLSLGYLIMLVMLWLILRQTRLVLAAMGVIVVGSIACLGVYGLMGHRLNMISAVLPTLVIVLGIADAVHFPTAMLHALPGRSPMAAALIGLRQVILPCLLTTLTTLAGLLALTSSPMAVVREFGLYAAVGLLASLVASVVLMAAVAPGLKPQPAEGPPGPLKRGLSRLRGGLETHPKSWASAALLITAVAGFGAAQVTTDTYTLGYLPTDHWVTENHRTIEANWGAYGLLDFTVTPTGDRDAHDPEVLAGMADFVHRATTIDGLNDGIGLHDIYRRTATVLGAQLKPGEPLSAAQVAQARMILEAQQLSWDRNDPAWAENVLAPLVTESGDQARLTLVGEVTSAKRLAEVLRQLEEHAAQAFVGRALVEPAGYPPLYVKIIDYVVGSQVRSFFVAIGLIFLLMLLWLRSLRLALLSLVPNLFPVLVMFGTMGALAIDLDVATATVAAIVIGVAIDDTVHFLHHWRCAENAGDQWSQCLRSTFDQAGVAATITTLLLVAGFPVLLFAGTKSIVSFGLLTTVAAAAALFGDLVILPLLLRLFPARKQFNHGS
jgi:uncharacterized protein